MTTRRRFLVQSTALTGAAVLAGCAGMASRTAPRVALAGIDSLPGEGLELRFMLKLRVQNPSDSDLRYDGIWVEIELRGQPLASGVAPVTGVVPRFSDAVVMLPVTASGLSIARQAITLMRGAREGNTVGPVTYLLRGRLGGLGLGGGDFESRGEIDLGNP
ncbi:MAG: LEA type 2 family protein [Burkholderiales bacterium]|nr:LEA type 2 family protein [Burkholderiales bacterium]